MSDCGDSRKNVLEITGRILSQLHLPSPYEGLDRIRLIVQLSQDMLSLSMADLVSLACWMKERLYPDQADSNT